MRMRINSIATLATLLVIVVGVANAQKTPEPNWVLFESTDTSDFYIDKSSLMRTGDVVTAWESFVLKKKKASVKILKEFNCKTRQHRRLTGTIYSKMNFTGDSMPMPKEDWIYVTRESIGEEALDFVCKNTPKGLMDYFK